MGNVEAAVDRYADALAIRNRLKTELAYADLELTDATDHLFELLEV